METTTESRTSTLGFDSSDGATPNSALDMLSTGLLSDCEVTIGSKTWRLHRFVLCTGSGFFRDAFCGGFAEAANNKVVFSEDVVSEEQFDWVIRWLYTGRPMISTDVALSPARVARFLRESVGMCVLADSLTMPDLCGALVDAIGRYPPYSEFYMAQERARDWVEATDLAYGAFDDGRQGPLKAALLDCLLPAEEDPRLLESIRRSRGFQELVTKQPGFARDWVSKSRAIDVARRTQARRPPTPDKEDSCPDSSLPQYEW